MGKSLNRRITPWSLLSFAAPSIIMMVFMSLYTIVDGIFVSRFVGSNALSSLNIVYPVVNVAIAIAMMLASGGNAIISKYLGEGNKKRACESLTQFVTVCILVSLVIVVISQMFLTEISRLLGSNEVLLADCKSYLGMVSLFIPACMLQTLFQMYLVSSEMPEVLGMSDRIIVMHEGHLGGEFTREQATQEVLMAAAVGKLNRVNQE